ncbi:MAG: hypothetical protein R3277_00085 [Brumimicrobium sp.]|nr:hypothetical protein [Brumimicrobium sp.]
MEDKNFISELKVPSADIYISSDGIMYIYLKIKGVVDMSHSKEIVNARTALAQKKKYPILYISENSFVTPSKEVIDYLTTPERGHLVLADAFVIKSFSQRLAAKTYILINKPSKPTRVFSRESEAVSWLKSFL